MLRLRPPTLPDAARLAAGEVTGEVEAQGAQATGQVAGQVTGEVAGQVAGEVGAQEAQASLTPTDVILLSACSQQPALAQTMRQAAGYRERTGNFKRSLEKLLEMQLLEMTLPERPTSPKQKYRLTAKGRAWLERASSSP